MHTMLRVYLPLNTIYNELLGLYVYKCTYRYFFFTYVIMHTYAYTFIACMSVGIYSLSNINYIDPIMIVTAIMKLVTYMFFTHIHTYEKRSQIAYALTTHRTRHDGPKLLLHYLTFPKYYPAQSVPSN